MSKHIKIKEGKMFNMLDNSVVLITRKFKKEVSKVVALSDKRANEYIKESKKGDNAGTKYEKEELWLI